MVELEHLTPFRFYKLKPIWLKRCNRTFDSGTRKCYGLLHLFRIDGTLRLRCPHVGCYQQYRIRRVCNICNSMYDFENTSCENCEPLVIQTAQYFITIEETTKSIKKLNKHYKMGDLSQKDWENAVKLNKTEKESCEKKLKELKERNLIIEKHLETLIIQP